MRVVISPSSLAIPLLTPPTVSTTTDEPARVAALRSYELLDTKSELAFDELVAMAAEVCDTPVAVVSLIDERRQWSKAAHGCPRGEVARELSFCTHAIESDEALIVTDATADPRFRDNPQVTAADGIRFYAGHPLVDSDGYALGTLCLIDNRTRTFDEVARRTLQRLADQVVHLMELRRSNRQLARCLKRVEEIATLVPMCGHCHAVRNDADEWQRIERYFHDLNGTKFTHGICPACLVRHYPEDLASIVH